MGIKSPLREVEGPAADHAAVTLPVAVDRGAGRSTAPVAYFAAVLVIGVAFAVKTVFDPYVGYHTPFLLLFAAVLLSSWYGGLGPGLLTGVLAAVTGIYFYPPQPTYAHTAVPVVIFLAEATVISFLIQRGRRSAEAERVAKGLALHREARLRDVSDSVPALIAYVDGDMRVAFCNLAASQWLGRNAGDLVGEHVQEVIGPWAYKDLTRFLSKALQGRRVKFETQVTSPARGLRWLAVELIPDVADGERVLGVYVLGTDQTDSRESAERLALLAGISEVLSQSLDYEETLNTMAQLAIPQLGDWCGVDLLDEDGAIRQVAAAHVDAAKASGAAEFRSNYAPMIGDCSGPARCIETGEPEFHPGITESDLREVARSEEHFEALRALNMSSLISIPLQARDKVLGALTFVWSDSGLKHTRQDVEFAKQIARRCANAIDNAMLYSVAQAKIKERMEAERALTQSRAQLRAILDNSSSVVFMKDPDGRYVFVNHEFAVIAGIEGENAVGMTDGEIFDEETAACLVEADYQALSKRMPHSGEITLNLPDGPKSYIGNHFPLFEGEDVYAVCGLLTDITERKRLEARLADIKAMESVGSLAGGVAHDFNNALTTIIGYSQLAQMKLTPNDPTRKDVEKVLNAAERASDLTRQLLAFARRQIVDPRVLDMNAVIDDLTSKISSISGAGTEIHVTRDPELWKIRADEEQVQQVVLDIAVNLCDLMGDGGSLTIRSENVALDHLMEHSAGYLPKGDYVRLSVSNSGPTIPPEALSRVFEPFFSVRKNHKQRGLGLATAYGIIKQSGGHIFVKSEEGGCEFTILLPRFEPDIHVSPTPVRDLLEVAGTPTVLVVEDEDSVRDLVITTLDKLGYRVLDAANGRDALNISNGYPGTIDLLLTDMVMPLVGGKELAQELAMNRPGLRVLMMSGYTDDLVEVTGAHFLQKPFTPGNLAQRVRDALGV